MSHPQHSHTWPSVYILALCSVPYRPLHIASKSGLVRVVQELVQRGADLDARDADGKRMEVYMHMMAGSD